MVYAKRGKVVRLLYLLVACAYFSINKLFRSRKRGSVVLCYHGVTQCQQPAFARQMEEVTRNIVSSGSLSVCLTFDDAFENLLLNVVPVITELEIPITIFIPTGCLGNCPSWLNGVHPDSNEKIMTHEQISILSNSPFVTFGSHTVTHPHLTELDKEEIGKELHDSKRVVEDILGGEIEQLAYPHGDHNDDIDRVAFDLEYQKVYTLDPVVQNTNDKVVGRFSMSPDVWPIEFFLTVKGAYSWLFPWRSFLKRIK